MAKTSKEIATEALTIASYVKEGLNRHLDDCSKQHEETNRRLDTIDKKITKAASYILRLLITVVLSMAGYIFSTL